MTAPEREALVKARDYIETIGWAVDGLRADGAEAMLAEINKALSNAPAVTVTEGWRDGSTAPEDGTEIIVGVTCRYALYRPDGARQMKKPGRWQRMGEFGWENCEKPERWSPLNSTTPQTGSQE